MYYCTKCGKEIEYEAEFCNECLEVERKEFFRKQNEKKKAGGPALATAFDKSKKEGLIGALIGTVFGGGSAIIALVMIILSALARVQLFAVTNAMVGTLFIDAALAILGAVFGIRAVKVYKEAKTQGRGNLKITWIFGLTSLIAAGAAAVLIIASFVTAGI